MSTSERDQNDTLEQGIAQWRSTLRRRQAIHAVDVDELEETTCAVT